MIGLGPKEEPFEFAVNVASDSEFAGAGFSADGEILFDNIQGEDAPGTGMTIAVWGPWERPALSPTELVSPGRRARRPFFCLAPRCHFYYSRNMEMTRIIGALAALAQETRLKVYRLLVEAGPEGLPAGRIGEALALPPATLSFHLSHLSRAGLARGRQHGRFVIYSADFQNMNALVAYLTENCCGGRACSPAPKTAAVRARRRAA